MSRKSPQLICFSYHKTGTSLLLHVMTKVCSRLGLTLANHYGLVEHLGVETDVVLLPHSLLRAPLDRAYRAIRLIRDPRDIWVSGYLYHLRCNEGWCRNSDLTQSSRIKWPQVDYSMEHRTEDWKCRYLERLGGRSYQQNLLDRCLVAGLEFELDGYTGSTLTTMQEWKLNQVDALDVKLEAVAADFDGTMLQIFDHFGFTQEQTRAALEEACSEDVRRMEDTDIAERPQIHSRTISKWQDFLPLKQRAYFEATYSALILELGYEVNDGGTSSGVTPEQDAPIRLMADGRLINPMFTGLGTYKFIVPAGRKQVMLVGGRWDVRVKDIAIASSVGEVVIPADDPSLDMGWHEAERSGNALRRWTNGTAVLPWVGVSGPAVVTVRCSALADEPSGSPRNRS